MKVFEILRDDIKSVTAEQLIQRMKRFDWKFEYSEQVVDTAKCLREMELIENMAYQLWKKEPETAVQIWYEHSGSAPTDKTVVPSFIVRLQAQEK